MQLQELRKTGIDIIGDVPWGMHFCQFYQTQKDLADILVPYFKAGLENNEFCMWVTADPLNVGDAQRAMRRAMPDFDAYVAKGQIEIIAYSDWCIKDGDFDSDRVLNGWVEKLNGALARGFSGLRLTGNTFWLEPARWQNFTDYEAAVDGVIGNYRMIALCTYSLEKCGAYELLDVVSNHRFALIKRAGHWQTIKSSRDRELRLALAKEREILQTIMDNAHTLLVYLDPDFNFVAVNAAYAENCNHTPEELIGKNHFSFYPHEENEAIFKRARDTGQAVYYHDKPFVFPDQPERGVTYWDWKLTPVKDGEGNVEGLVFSLVETTERKKAEETIENLASFPGENPNPVMRIAGDGKVTYANQASQVLQDFWQCQVGTALPLPYLKFIQDALLSGETKGDEINYRNRTFALTFAPIPGKGYVNIYGRDITDRKRTENELRQTRDYLNNLLDYANAPIIVWNPSYEITRFNHAFERLTGFAAADVLGKQLDSLFPADRREESVRHIQEALAEQRWESVEIPILSKSGELRTVLWNSATLWEADEKTLVATIAQGQDITERKQMEEALRRSEGELSTILANVPILMLLVDPERRVVKVNDAVEKFAHRPSGEMLGLRGGEVLGCVNSFDDPHGCGFGQECQYCKTRLTVLDTFETGTNHYQVEWQLPFLRDGKKEEITFLLSTVLMPSSERQVLVCIEDISELKRAEEAVKEARDAAESERRRLATILRMVPSGVVIIEKPDGRITYVNEHAFELYGMDPRGLEMADHPKIGMRRMDGSRCPAEDLPTSRALLHGEVVRAEELIIERLGSERVIVSANAVPLRDRSGEIVAAIGSFDDITERKKMDQLKDDFIGMVSHELKTPLTVVTGALYTAMTKGVSQKDRKDLLMDAVSGAEELTSIIDNLLELSRYQADRLQLNIEPVNVSNVIHSVIGKLSKKSSLHHLVADIPEGLSAVKADPFRLERILYNLIDNAIKYSPKGGRVAVSAQEYDASVVVAVRDQGMGISPEYQAVLFEPFQRVPQSYIGIAGVGLGLNVCRRLLEVQGGRIWVESEVGKGSTFYFTLPRVE